MNARAWAVAAMLVLLAGVVLAVVAGAAPVALAAGTLIGGGAILTGGALLRPTMRGDATVQASAAIPATSELERLLVAIDDPLLLVEGRTVTRANPAAIALLGPHVVGEDVRLAIRNPAAAELLARDGDASDAPAAIEIAGVGDRDRHWTLTAHPLDGDRRLVRLADRTEGRAAERMRVDFVANASHELRTPLASLMGFIETLEDANGPADAAVRKRFLAIMAGEARRMQRLVDDLISLSRIEADRHRAPADAVDLATLAHEAVDVLGGDPKVRGRVELAIDNGIAPVAGDRAQLSQLVHNLLGNALKYGREDRPVRLAITTGGSSARLLVEDEGDGIAPEHLPRLTERFYRVDPGRSRAVGGTGLGLSIVKHIVERHRGRLDIQSTPGVGTRVTVTLPLARSAASTAADAAAA